jgi:hypothetical protein
MHDIYTDFLINLYLLQKWIVGIGVHVGSSPYKHASESVSGW